MRRACIVVLPLALFLLPVSFPVSAQIASTAPGPAPAAPGPLSRYRFHLNAVRVATGDPQLRWDADLGGDLDLYDYRAGRITFLANYEAILGDERRAFDPVQGNYTLDLSASHRTRHGEISGVFHHLSRHLSDREKPEPVDWNMIGVRFVRPYARGRVAAAMAGHALFTVQRSSVDYDAEYGAEARADYRVDARRAAFAAATLHTFNTDGSIAGRGWQNGGRVEGGFRFAGGAAALELVAALERRVDDHPIGRGNATWLFAGFRLLHP